MKNTRLNYLIVGSFVLAILVGLVVTLGLLTGRTGATDPYYIVFNNVTGLKFGSQVLYEGYPIGQVEEIVPMPGDGGMEFRVEISVTEDWQIPADSKAVISASGLLAAITISISAGQSDTMLEPGSRIASRGTANIMATLSSVAAQFAELSEGSIKPLVASLTATSDTLRHIMRDEGAPLLGSARVLIERLEDDVPALTRELRAASEDVRVATVEFRRLASPENRRRIEATLVHAETAGEQFARLGADLRRTGQRLETTLQGVDAMVAESRPEVAGTLEDARYVMDSLARRIDIITQNLEGMSRNMYEFSRQLRQNPGLLLNVKPPRDEGRR